jgi:redox-sensitive bicupin YhaK (pirin superfamily)
MLWADRIPRRVVQDMAGRKTEVTVVAGRFGDVEPPAPPPDSWAAQPEADVAIWTLRMEPGAGFQLPPAQLAGTRRTLYFFAGTAASVAGQPVQGPVAITLEADVEVALAAGDSVCEFLLLQGRPIGEPVAQYGPFVMNTQQEIMQAMQDYRRTQFGGWKFADAGPVHGTAPQRFARYPDGREETPGA